MNGTAMRKPTQLPRASTHIERRLGYLKAQSLLCDVATVSGMTFSGYVVSFDNTAVVLKPRHSDDPADLITIAMRGLEFIAPYNSTPQQ